MENNEGNSLPGFDSVDALTTFFETHDMGAYLDHMPEVHFDVDIRRRRYLVAIEAEVMKKLTEIARAEHTSAEALINAWLHERASKAA